MSSKSSRRSQPARRPAPKQSAPTRGGRPAPGGRPAAETPAQQPAAEPAPAPAPLQAFRPATPTRLPASAAGRSAVLPQGPAGGARPVAARATGAGSPVPGSAAAADGGSAAPSTATGATATVGGGVAVLDPPGGRPVLVRDMPDGPLQVMSWNCSALPDEVPHGLGVTYWFDAAPTGEPYPVSIRVTGRRISGPAAEGRPESFDEIRTLERVVPGSGRVALTVRVADLAPGEWEVSTAPVSPKAAGRTGAPVSLPRGRATGATAFLPVANIRAPGMRLPAWPSLVLTGFFAALVLQVLLAGQRQLPSGRLLLTSVVASLLGLAGAKVYYLLTHRSERASPLTAGMSVQGFVIVALAVLVLGSALVGVPVGAALDVSAPGLLVGLTVGRLGCFLGGCCVGRPTSSRWGIWSSDRRVGVRRIPVQLMESGWAGVTAAATFVAVLTVRPAVDGLLFVAGFAAYLFGRQLLFPLRSIPRATTHGRTAMLVGSGLVAVAAIAVLLVA